ncbi:MAG: hypothetical protein ACRDGV_10465 [Candidatus Limnocylindria bacterium]
MDAPGDRQRMIRSLRLLRASYRSAYESVAATEGDAGERSSRLLKLLQRTGDLLDRLTPQLRRYADDGEIGELVEEMRAELSKRAGELQS